MSMSSLFYVLCLAAGLLAFASNASAQRIRGVPGVDYPNYTKIPKTSFKCSDQKHNPGFYADTETDCQVFHFCYKRRSESFLCPAGTIFNQAILACDSWFNSNCSLATMYYVVNASPSMKNAGKNIPMLRKLRDRVRSSTVQTEPPTSSTTTTTTTTTTMAPETEPPVEQFEQFPAESFEHETEVDFSRDDEMVESRETDYEHPNQFDSDQVVEQAEDFQEVSTFDPVTDDARLRPFDADREGPVPHPEPVWRNPAAQEFTEEYNAQQMREAAQRAEFLKQIVTSTTLSPFFQENAGPAVDNAGQFSKRHGSPFSAAVARRNRRKPTYVVMEQKPDHMHAVAYEPTTEVPVTTEEPITEGISMDTLVELNTQLPVDYTVVKDESGYYEPQEMEDFEPREPYQDASPEMDEVEHVGYEDQEVYDAQDQEGNEEYVTEGYTTEYLEPSDEFTTEYYAEQSEFEPEEQIEEEVDEDIVVYDDSSNQQPQRVVPANVPQAGHGERMIIIPDETDFLSTPASVPETSSEDFAEGDAEERDDIYIVDDNVEGRPGYRYQVIPDKGNQAFYDPRAQAGFMPYSGPSAVPGRSYPYQVPPGGMNYGRMQAPGYDYGQYQRYPPNYYQYVDEYGRPLNPNHVDPTIQHMPEDSDQADEPDGTYEHGVYGDSYDGMQSEGQPEEEGQYVYNPETGYYHTPDGRIYTSEGVEVQASANHDSAGLGDSAEEAGEDQKYPEEPFEGQFAPIPGESGAGFSMESDAAIADSMAASSEPVEAGQDGMAQEETYDVTQNGLMADSEEWPKDGFIGLDEGEPGAADASEDFADESHDFDSAFEESAEEVVAEDMAIGDNETESARAGDGAHEFPEEEAEKIPEPETPAFQDHQQEPEKSGVHALETESSWPPEQPASLDSEPAPPSLAQEPSAADPFSLVGSSEAVPSAPQSVPEPFSSAFQQSSALNPFAAAGMSGPGDFMAPSENQFMNMGFQSPMDFGPYGLGPNVRQQFGMKDSSNRPSFSGGKSKGRPSRNPLSSLKNVKQGKFGMFKKMMMQNV